MGPFDPRLFSEGIWSESIQWKYLVQSWLTFGLRLLGLRTFCETLWSKAVQFNSVWCESVLSTCIRWFRLVWGQQAWVHLLRPFGLTQFVFKAFCPGVFSKSYWSKAFPGCRLDWSHRVTLFVPRLTSLGPLIETLWWSHSVWGHKEIVFGLRPSGLRELRFFSLRTFSWFKAIWSKGHWVFSSWLFGGHFIYTSTILFCRPFCPKWYISWTFAFFYEVGSFLICAPYVLLISGKFFFFLICQLASWELFRTDSCFSHFVYMVYMTLILYSLKIKIFYFISMLPLWFIPQNHVFCKLTKNDIFPCKEEMDVLYVVFKKDSTTTFHQVLLILKSNGQWTPMVKQQLANISLKPHLF